MAEVIRIKEVAATSGYLNRPLRSLAQAKADCANTLGQRLLRCDRIATSHGYAMWTEFYRLYNAGYSPEDALIRLGLCAPITQEAAE